MCLEVEFEEWVRVGCTMLSPGRPARTKAKGWGMRVGEGGSFGTGIRSWRTLTSG